MTRYFQNVRGEQLDTFFSQKSAKKFKKLRKKGENLRISNNPESKNISFTSQISDMKKDLGTTFWKKTPFWMCR